MVGADMKSGVRVVINVAVVGPLAPLPVGGTKGIRRCGCARGCWLAGKGEGTISSSGLIGSWLVVAPVGALAGCALVVVLCGAAAAAAAALGLVEA